MVDAAVGNCVAVIVIVQEMTVVSQTRICILPSKMLPIRPPTHLNLLIAVVLGCDETVCIHMFTQLCTHRTLYLCFYIQVSSSYNIAQTRIAKGVMEIQERMRSITNPGKGTVPLHVCKQKKFSN